VSRFRRSAVSFILGSVALAVLTFVCLKLQISAAVLFLIVVVFVALDGSFAAAAGVSIVGALLLQYYFAAPILSLRGADSRNALRFALWLVTAFVITRLVARTRRREEDLRHAQADLERVTRVTTMGELVASIAHEVNQPLAAVVTNANAALRWLAADPPNLDEVRQATVRIIADGNRASDVVARIRALLTKSEARREPLSVDAVIDDVVALTKGAALRNGTSVHLELSADPAVVLADRVQIQQVLLNLILNGMEAMNGVTGRARNLTIQSRPNNGNGVFVAVRDSGAGISAEHLPHIFDAFYTTKSGGLGMGLAIGRSIIESHGGRIWATTEPAGGSTFQFTLPAAEVEAP
jgi:C4-dicarboxylate-specific signal transduction histidine kinase